MNVLDAARATVKAYPGGAESLAPRLGPKMTGALLRAKVNQEQERNHLTLEEADLVIEVTGDHRMLFAWAAQFGYTLSKIDDRVDNDSIMSRVLDLGVAEGDLSRTIHDALEDNVITENEMRAIDAAGFAHQAALIGLVRRLHQAKRAVNP